MECLYSTDIFEEKNSISISDDELKHVKALRLNREEKVLITNGKGITCLCELFNINKEKAEFLIRERYELMNENNYNTALGISILSSRERFEFAVEKAVELGINKIIPLYSKFTQKIKFKNKRIEAKILTALKQSKRSVLPDLEELTKFSELKKIAPNYDNIILLDDSGDTPSNDTLGDNILIIVGPEGGFDSDEIKNLTDEKNTVIWNLGQRRLRSETASVVALSTLNFLKQISN